ncbi:unnamed protein product [Lathyrus sativus]|nr:unnamed protein product [Lathyrus sativus]
MSIITIEFNSSFFRLHPPNNDNIFLLGTFIQMRFLASINLDNHLENHVILVVMEEKTLLKDNLLILVVCSRYIIKYSFLAKHMLDPNLGCMDATLQNKNNCFIIIPTRRTSWQIPIPHLLLR